MKISTVFNIAAVLALAAGAPSQAFAQARPAAAPRGPVLEPNTQWTGADWARSMKDWINGSRIVGKPEIYFINGTDKSLRVECEQANGKHWTLVGPTPEVKGNPTELPPFKMTQASTYKFDGYCDAVSGYANNDDRYIGEMSKPKDFTGSAYITFVPKS